MPATEHRNIADIIDQCKQQRVGFYVVPDLFEIQLNTVDLDSIGGIPIIGLRDGGIVGWGLFSKRLLDTLISTAVLVLGSPVFLIVALAIKLSSSGGVFYAAERVGKDGTPFLMYKFRSMREDADQLRSALADHNQADGPLFKIADDPRRTWVGGWLRRLSLDELPQFWNILRGDMSLVGPRAPLAEEVEQYEEWQMKRLTVKPGLTGLWQVNGRSNVPFEEMVMMDIYYIDNWSFGLDINLLIRTIPAVIRREGAY
jgi:exopolysaccharide biosynthesis polyprenyl glycosylphosphotransferase